ncbi:hypothetical protein A2773_03485 [Candidatus Gottesmanbacteria bacterium RIFCSPHIGHO2_01_FULL_39_10]|uniref:PIN domain-containing protein n=1 Tax=Candidatus Gottesmanbacteria bacterium RIFCSPHIGHO2_01_FULL_39_10 TaxID=1798375 RepID=A0A1F5ZPT1_9BACT|nr:MAG: hypothetical protein A2773_03485 [Candidatus Gottesmanbacteria bacterium RIFCSPHIGHO2_01_FULL_39_10]
MKVFLLDSDILMDFFKKKSFAERLLAELYKKGKLATSILSVSELCSGWNKEQTKFFVPLLFDLVDIYFIDKKIAQLAGKFRFEFKKKGINLPVIDTLIASTAIQNKLTLVTRNIKDYPMKELKIYKIPEV